MRVGAKAREDIRRRVVETCVGRIGGNSNHFDCGSEAEFDFGKPDSTNGVSYGRLRGACARNHNVDRRVGSPIDIDALPVTCE